MVQEFQVDTERILSKGRRDSDQYKVIHLSRVNRRSRQLPVSPRRWKTDDIRCGTTRSHTSRHENVYRVSLEFFDFSLVQRENEFVQSRKGNETLMVVFRNNTRCCHKDSAVNVGEAPSPTNRRTDVGAKYLPPVSTYLTSFFDTWVPSVVASSAARTATLRT